MSNQLGYKSHGIPIISSLILALMLTACGSDSSPEVHGSPGGTGGTSGPNTPSTPPNQSAIVRGEDKATTAGMIVPPGATVESTREIDPYDDLVQGYPELTPETLIGTFFKDAKFREIDDPDFNFEQQLPDDVILKRDAQWGVPHIYATTDEGAFYGAGYATAEDRGPIIELLRALGRYEAFDTLGTNASWLADAEMVRLYGYTDEEFQAQLDRLAELDPERGPGLIALAQHYIDGINDSCTVTGECSPDWEPLDIVAATTVVRAYLGPLVVANSITPRFIWV